MNWYNATVTDDEVDTIPNIKELDWPEPLIESIRDFSKNKDIILAPGNKPLEELLSCKKPEQNPIVIVAVAIKQAHEKDDNKLPYYLQFTVLMLLIQDEPHFIIPASTTNIYLHLGKMIQNKDLCKTSFKEYMQKNVNQKLVPIHTDCDGTKPQRKLKIHSYYTTASAVACSH